MKILSKKEMHEKVINSIFRKGGTLSMPKNCIRRYCTGKYTSKIIGKEITPTSEIKCVWAEARYDNGGKFYRLYCV